MKLNWAYITSIIWSAIAISLMISLGFIFLKTKSTTVLPNIPKEHYKVIYVHDGDSFTIEYEGKSQRVRLMGTDAPELNQPYGTYARNTLAKLILNKNIAFIYRTADHYDRFLGRVSVVSESTGETEIEDVGLELIKNGASWAHRAHKSFRQTYLQTQKNAEQNKIGLWIQEDPTKPGDYRDFKKNNWD